MTMKMVVGVNNITNLIIINQKHITSLTYNEELLISLSNSSTISSKDLFTLFTNS